jgi:hypothetical protein
VCGVDVAIWWNDKVRLARLGDGTCRNQRERARGADNQLHNGFPTPGKHGARSFSSTDQTKIPDLSRLAQGIYWLN